MLGGGEGFLNFCGPSDPRRDPIANSRSEFAMGSLIRANGAAPGRVLRHALEARLGNFVVDVTLSSAALPH